MITAPFYKRGNSGSKLVTLVTTASKMQDSKQGFSNSKAKMLFFLEKTRAA